MMHAATYFADADAQYRVGKMYLEDDAAGANRLSARWLTLAARKGHAAAQARLGNLLFNGGEGIAANPIDGLRWLILASRRAAGTPDQEWIEIMLNDAMSVAVPEHRINAMELAEGLDTRLGGL
jgi:TPR repeat protein